MGVGDGLFDTDGDGNIVGVGIITIVGLGDGISVGNGVAVGVGSNVGAAVGVTVGVIVGVSVGTIVGTGVGEDGLFVEPGVEVLNVTQLSCPSGRRPIEIFIPGSAKYCFSSIEVVLPSDSFNLTVSPSLFNLFENV